MMDAIAGGVTLAAVAVALIVGLIPFARLVISNGARESKINDIKERVK
ncbi:hypothetical protein ACFLVC_00045 [Chloroflexota bacterium]